MSADHEEVTHMAVLDGVTLPPRWRITPRLLPGWPIDGEHLLELWPCGRSTDGRLSWLYRLSRYGRTIFTSTDISSPIGGTLSTESLIATGRTVLAFLTLGEGDTDEEYFSHYTRAQLKWRDQFAEALSGYAMDDLCAYCGGDHASPGCASI
ncbi:MULTISPECIES: hypothetical protein [unclassified Nonomuraea]|uniref:hypothetical protein n=1 Tax=unclassified Nonomuraea TaxID=2593643 RepID=UPI0033E09551